MKIGAFKESIVVASLHDMNNLSSIVTNLRIFLFHFLQHVPRYPAKLVWMNAKQERTVRLCKGFV